MESNNGVDFQGEIGYNEGTKYDENDFVVKMDEQAPINDIECLHEELVPNPEDTIGQAVYHGCTNRKCGVGFYIKT